MPSGYPACANATPPLRDLRSENRHGLGEDCACPASLARAMLDTVLRLPLLAFVLVLLAAAPAQATELFLDTGMSDPQPFQSWIDNARVPTPPGGVTLRLTPCDDATALGCSAHDGRLIEIDPGWLRPHVLLHALR